jgi:pre-mRNA-splicing factor SYF1
MPRIWLGYIALTINQDTKPRVWKIFDRALRTLPLGQHNRLWPTYLEFLRGGSCPKQIVEKFYTRYLMLEPSQVEEYIGYLKTIGYWSEAAEQLSRIMNEPSYRSLNEKSPYQLWIELCEILTKHSTTWQSIQVENTIRRGICKYRSEPGRLWVSLADYYIRKSNFDRAKDIYEEGLSNVVKINDFAIIFSAYARFNESIIKLKFSLMSKKSHSTKNLETSTELDIRLASFRLLMEKRPDLASSIILSQTPFSITKWLKRVQIFKNRPVKQIATFLEAVSVVTPSKAKGKPSSLWCAFANFYDTHHDYDNARLICRKAVSEPFHSLEDLVNVYCEWMNMELRNNKREEARKLLRITLWVPKNVGKTVDVNLLPVQRRIFKSTKLWNLLCDIEESNGSFDSVKAVNYRMMDLQTYTPQTFINFAQFLLERKCFEEAFQIYERGIESFCYPYSLDIWQSYLLQFVNHYHDKLERIRDLFEQALVSVPIEARHKIYVLYAETEERLGILERAVAIYKRAIYDVSKTTRLSIYKIFIQKTYLYSGIPGLREAYEIAIKSTEAGFLEKDDAMELCFYYADFECLIGELERARTVYINASKFITQNNEKGFWKHWSKFEIKYGNEESFRDLLRLKRAVTASFATLTNIFTNDHE